MELVKISQSNKILRFSNSTPAKGTKNRTAPQSVRHIHKKDLQIEIIERKTNNLHLICLDITSNKIKPFQIEIPGCTTITLVVVTGGATLQFANDSKALLGKDTSFVGYFASGMFALQPTTNHFSVVMIASKLKRSIFPNQFQLIEDFFTKTATQKETFLFPGPYPITAITKQNLRLLFQPETSNPLVEIIYKTIIARETEARTIAYQNFQKVSATPKRDEAIYEVVEQVLLHLEDAHSIKSLAASIFMSANNLTKKFRKATGQSIFTFLRETKRTRAIELLITTNTNDEEIAAKVGFTSKLQFARFMKRQTGKTPSQFRYRNQNLLSAPNPE